MKTNAELNGCFHVLVEMGFDGTEKDPADVGLYNVRGVFEAMTCFEFCLARWSIIL
jgi:hypothetical protein